jgi:prepilin peptidase CpaA
MPGSAGGEVALAIYVFPLVLAAVSDFHSLRIPNWLTASLAAAFFAAALLFGHNVDWLSHLAAGVAVFVGAAVLFFFGVMGGGDVKLMAATALWTGLGQLLPFLFMTAVVGGVFALAVLLLRHPVVQASFLATLRRLPSFAQKNMPIPYGIPIAIAGILMAPSLGFLA